MTKKEMPLHVVFVEAWVKKGNKYLVAKRSSKDDQAAGKWAMPGGKVDMELGIGVVEETLKREVMKEVGIEVSNAKFFSSKAFIRSSGHHVVGMSFVIDYESGEAKPLDGQDEVKWVDFNELEDLFSSNDYFSDILLRLKKFENLK